MNKEIDADSQAKHQDIITRLNAAYAQRATAQDAVNAAIRQLRALERLCQNLGEQLATIDQLMLIQMGKAGAGE